MFCFINPLGFTRLKEAEVNIQFCCFDWFCAALLGLCALQQHLTLQLFGTYRFSVFCLNVLENFENDKDHFEHPSLRDLALTSSAHTISVLSLENILCTDVQTAQQVAGQLNSTSCRSCNWFLCS